MERSLQFGTRLGLEPLERRAMLSATTLTGLSSAASLFGNFGPIQLQPTNNVSASVTAPQISSLLNNTLQNVQSMGQLAGAVVSDPAITSGLRADLASLSTAIHQIADNVGNSSLAANLMVQIGVTSTSNPQTAALLNSLLTNVAGDLQAIGSAAEDVGTSVSDTLSNPLSTGLAQVGNVVAGLNFLISGASGGMGVDLAELQSSLAGNASLAASELNSLTGALGPATSTVTTGFENSTASLGSFVTSTIQNVNGELQNVNATISSVPLAQPGALVTAGTSALQDVGGVAMNPLASQPVALITAGTSPLQDVGGMAVNPLLAQPVALTTAGTSPLQDVAGVAVNPQLIQPVPLTTVITAEGGEFQTTSLPSNQSPALLNEEETIQSSATGSVSDFLDTVNQAVDAVLAEQPLDTTVVDQFSF